MRKTNIALAFAIALSCFGCAGSYTDIRANDDGTYILTHTTQNFFRVYGEIYRCRPEGVEKLVCTSIDRL